MSRDTHRAGEQLVKAPNGMVGQEFQSAKVVLSGSPEHVTFSGMGLEDMVDNQYRIFASGEGPGVVDESTITATGFDITGGTASDVVHILVHGRVASRV